MTTKLEKKLTKRRDGIYNLGSSKEFRERKKSEFDPADQVDLMQGFNSKTWSVHDKIEAEFSYDLNIEKASHAKFRLYTE